MQISKDFRKKLVNELRFCADRISREKDLRKKVFFLSNAEGVVTCTLDFEYDPQLVLIELVLDTAIATIAQRIEAILSENTTVELVDGLFDRLCSCLSELAVNIDESQDTYRTLEKIAELAHTTTDRGYFIYTKGLKSSKD